MKKKTGILTFVGMVILTIGMIVLAGCEFDEPSKSSDAGSSSLQIPLFKMEYDETKEVFALQWPGSTIHNPGLSKTMTDNDNMLLVDYQNIQTVMTIDDSGYFQYRKTHIQGDESIRMPYDLYQDVKNIMPEYSQDHDPIVSTEFLKGVIFKKTKNGKIITSPATFDPEAFHIDPALLQIVIDSLAASSDSLGSVGNRVLAELDAKGINYEFIGESLIEFEMPHPDTENMRIIKKIQDLKTGVVIRKAVILKNGNYESVTMNDYKTLSGLPVLANRMRYVFGDIGGTWNAKYLIVNNRKNMSLTIN